MLSIRYFVAWEQRKLGDTVNSIVAGGDIDKSKIQENGKYPVYANALTNDGVIGYYNDQYRVKAPAVTVTGRGEIGVAKTRNTNFTPVVRLLAINSMHNNYFLENLINTHRAFAESTGVPQLTAPQLANYKLKFPKSIEEESKIGNFFNNLDSLITLHQRKLDKLKRVKSAYLTEMFPAEGEREPKRRFPGFTVAWEQRKLGDVVAIIMGQSPASKNYTENPNDYILVQGNADMKDGRVAPRVWTTQITKQAEKGDLILSVRAPVGDVGRTDYDVVIGRGVAAVKGNEYIFQLLTKMKDSGYWTMFSTGSTFESINSSNIKNAQVMIPTEKEQNQIGAFLHHYDSLIALHQRELNSEGNDKNGKKHY